MINIQQLKESMLAEMDSADHAQIEAMMQAYKRIMLTVADCELNDRQTMIALCHSLIRCAKIIGCSKENLVEDLSTMFDILTLVEAEAEGGMQ